MNKIIQTYRAAAYVFKFGQIIQSRHQTYAL